MNYQDWEQTVPDAIRNDTLWKVTAYRFALFASDLAWYDVSKLMQDKRTIEIASQLYRAIGSISANIAEGYSYRSDKNEARYYEYAYGSARESRDWYFKARHVLGEPVCQHRIALLANVIQLLKVTVANTRNPGKSFREDAEPYITIDLTNDAPIPSQHHSITA
jgi:four helix bundle protein